MPLQERNNKAKDGSCTSLSLAFACSLYISLILSFFYQHLPIFLFLTQSNLVCHEFFFPLDLLFSLSLSLPLFPLLPEISHLGVRVRKTEGERRVVLMSLLCHHMTRRQNTTEGEKKVKRKRKERHWRQKRKEQNGR